MIRFLTFIVLITATLFASVNPLVIFNAGKLKNQTIAIPLPSQQIIRGKSSETGIYKLTNKDPILLLLKPQESLYIVPKDETKGSFLTEVSLDGRLFVEQPMDKDNERYTLYNRFNKVLSVKLTGIDEMHVSVLATLNESFLNQLESTEVELQGKRTSVFSRKKVSQEVYHNVKTESEFSFKVRGPGTLRLKMRAPIDGVDALSSYRQRILLTLKGDNTQSLESYSRKSLEYIRENGKTPVTQSTSHFIPVEAGENTIIIQNFSNILLRADMFHSSVLNTYNDTNLTWKVPKSFTAINQPKWSNSNADDGLKRMSSILSQKQSIIDSVQRKGLLQSANMSTSMNTVYPTKIPSAAEIENVYFGVYSLYLKDDIVLRTMLKDNEALTQLNTLKKGAFFEVPVQGSRSEKGSYLMTLEKLYFKTRQYKLDRELMRQLEGNVNTLKDFEQIYLFGHTDSAGDAKKNERLSQQRCENVKDALVALGIDIEKIKMYAKGEDDNAVRTGDQTKEISNRRVEIRVQKSTLDNKKLEYHFKQPLEQETKFEVTVLNLDNNNTELYVNIDDIDHKVLRYEKNSGFLDLAFSEAFQVLDTYNGRMKKELLEAMKVLKNTSELNISKQTGTTTLILPKGTRYIGLSRPKGNIPFKIALRKQDSVKYKDTPYSLAHDYNNTYRRFASSLNEDLPSDKVFDAWYQHTHPLRLWMNARNAAAHINVNNEKVPESSDLDYARVLIQRHDKHTALQIAKHALLFSDKTSVQDQAYSILLELSSDTSQKLMWHSVYFNKTASAKSLKEIVLLLQEEGQFELALNALLLLEDDAFYKQKGSELAVLLNNTALSRRLDPLSNDDIDLSSGLSFIRKKSDLLSQRQYKSAKRLQTDSVKQAAGVVKLYSKSTDQIINRYKATIAQPIDLEVDGPVRLELDIRLFSSTKPYEWMRIEHNNKEYHYPLMQSQESGSLEVLPGNSSVTQSNNLELQLGKGHHSLRLHCYDEAIAVGIHSKGLENDDVPELSEQILQTSDYDAGWWVKQKPVATLPYASALLWNYKNSIYQHRYHAQAQAVMLKETVQSPEVESIFRALRQYSGFLTYSSLSTEAGFYDIKVPRWNPQSSLHYNRTPLLKDIEKYNIVLMDSDKKVIHMQGPQLLRVEAKQVIPDYLASTPISFAISLDSNHEEVIHDISQSKTFNREFLLPPGNHNVKIRLIDPLSTHYLGVDIYENDHKLESNTKQRYFVTRLDKPVTVHENGPKLLRIDEKLKNDQMLRSYVYLSDEQEYHHKILPSKNEDESLVRVSELIFDPLKKASEIVKKRSGLSALLTQTPGEEISFPVAEKQELIIQSFDMTCSAELGIRSQELSSDDDPDSVAETVAQVGQYCRKRISDETYIRQHYYSRLYDNPFLALTHKVYTKVPVEDAWGTFEANAYFQESGYDFKNINLTGELFIKERLVPQWRHMYSVGAFKNFLDYDNPESDSLDPLVYSRYKRDHQYGAYLKYDLYYRMYSDTEFAFESQATSNEALGIIDNIKIKPMIRHLSYPFYLNAYYDNRRYFEDRDRPDSYSVNRVGGKLRYDTFFNTNRLQLQADLLYKIESDDTQFTMQLIWHFSKNRRYYNFMPDEKLFNSLRLRLEEEKE